MKPLLYSMFGFLRASKPAPAALTLRAGFERYFAEVSVLKKGNGISDRSLIKTWMGTDYADWPMVNIGGEQVAAQRDLWLIKYQPATVVRRLAILSHLYSIASREWTHRELENPVKMIRKPKMRNARKRRIFNDIHLTGYPQSELEWLIDAVDSKYMRPVLRLAVETAMRRSELAGLRWENINLSDRTAFLPDTKNGHDRTVPLSPAAISIFEEMRSEGVTGPVFAARADYFTKLFVKAVKRSREKYLRICEEQGVLQDPKHFTNLRFHDLRHEAISTMAPHFHAHELAKISGHRDTRMLMRYFHPDPSQLASRLAAM